VPVDDMILGGTERASVEAIGGVCRQLAEGGLIEWSGNLGQGPRIGSARITGRGVDVVEQGGTAGIDIRVQSRAAPAMYSRDTVIAGSHMLKALGHSGISEFLLEVGLPDSVAAGSGLQARAISLAKFAIENPAELSPAQRTIAFEIIRRATALWQQGTTTNLRPDDPSKCIHPAWAAVPPVC
jgi:hypothetical protein